MTKQYGFIPPVIKIEDYVFGSLDESKTLKGEVIRADGQWDSDLPENEMQNRYGFETYNCTNYGTLNCKNTLEQAKYGSFRDDSERFLGVVSETRPGGNNPHSVAEAVRKFGLIPEPELTWTPDINTWAEYYSPNPMTQKYLDMGKKWLKEFEFKHEYAFYGSHTLKEKQTRIMEALKYSPIGISVYAWVTRNGLYYKPSGVADNHWVCLYGYSKDKYWKIFDSYDSTHKKVEWNTNFSFGKKYQLTRIGEDNSEKKNMLQRKEGTQEVFLTLGGKRYWIKDQADFEALKESQPIEKIEWENVEKVEDFTYPYDGAIIGTPNFADYLKQLFGKIK